jgi:hypothetical protein
MEVPLHGQWSTSIDKTKYKYIEKGSTSIDKKGVYEHIKRSTSTQKKVQVYRKWSTSTIKNRALVLQ